MRDRVRFHGRQQCPLILIAVYCFGLLLHPEVARAQFGELPPGAVSSSRMGSADEIVLYVMFDPAIAQDLLPEGIRFRTLEEIARRPDSAVVADYLRSHPERKGWARSFVEIIHPASLEYDGYTAQLGAHGGMAIWYAYVARADQSDTRPKGYQTLSLGTWLSDRKLVEHMRAKGYPAEYAQIVFGQDRSGVVHGKLKNRDLEVRGRCRLVGAAYKPDFGEPPFLQTIWTPRPLAMTFEIVTFYGHAQQDCSAADWRIRGEDRLGKAFRNHVGVSAEINGTDYYAHYVLRGGLYRRTQSASNNSSNRTRN